MPLAELLLAVVEMPPELHLLVEKESCFRSRGLLDGVHLAQHSDFNF